MSFSKFLYNLKQYINPIKKTVKYSLADRELFLDFLMHLEKPYKDNSKQGLALEKFIAHIYNLAGYEAYVTSKTEKNADQGVDVIAKKGKQTIFIQCKNYRIDINTPNIVGIAPIQKFNGISGKAEKIFITTSFFQGTINKQDFPSIRFVDRKELFALINELVPNLLLEYIFEKSIEETPIKHCPKCDDGFIIKKRTNKNFYFFGCTNYSHCKYTEKETKP